MHPLSNGRDEVAIPGSLAKQCAIAILSMKEEGQAVRPSREHRRGGAGTAGRCARRAGWRGAVASSGAVVLHRADQAGTRDAIASKHSTTKLRFAKKRLLQDERRAKVEHP